MPQLSSEGERIIAGIASRYAISTDAVKMMLDAVVRGGGGMAQFNVPELGGNGQWMRGGMTMVGDMFNNSLKATVDNLCSELSNLLANQPGLMMPLQMQSQSQSSSGATQGVSLFVPQSSYGWWPSELGIPASTGSQNSVRYAYFPNNGRLAIDYGGRVEVYDTSGHDIQGFGQQQSGDASLTFTSQRGLVRVDHLPNITRGQASPEMVQPGQPAAASPEIAQPQRAAQPPAGGDTSSIIALIQQLADLKEKGILTDDEFASKKAELLKRL